MKIILKFMRPFYGRMFFGLFIKIIGTVMDLFLPYILAHIIDDIVPAGKQNDIFSWGAIMILSSVIALAGNICANRIASAVARDTTKALRHSLFSKVMYLSSERLDEFTVPSLESRLTSDTYQIHRVLGMVQRLGVRAPILLIGGIAMTLALDPVLTLVMTATLPFISLTVYLISKKGIPMFTDVQRGVDDMTRVVRENARGIRVVKALSKTDYEKRHFDRANRELVRLEKKANLTMSLTNPMMTLFLNIGLASVIFVGALRVRGGFTKPGTIIAFMSYFTIVTNAMLSITRIFTMVSRGTASANRIAEVLNSEPDLPVASKGEKTTDDGYIVFDNVSFSYKGAKDNLRNISFSLQKGATLGIIGSTGSGKSTIIELIMRYYDANSGNIFIDGRDIRTYEYKELHGKIGIVRQNDFLYNDTIEDNIKFGRNISHESVVRAAEIAQASKFIEGKEGGYNYVLTAKGTNVSGGQKQRLLIARAVAASPELLILDDSSSALDYKTDAALRRRIAEEYSDTTTVIVAQRVSSIMSSDLIIVLEDGEIIASGVHDELMENCDVYREISETQLGGAILD
ncbi:MAG: ABC transporter ATP-binding protein [Clostridia bacterium]|nr:ABC transporter ATP-binding protein [Clostridia bacterium]